MDDFMTVKISMKNLLGTDIAKDQNQDDELCGHHQLKMYHATVQSMLSPSDFVALNHKLYTEMVLRFVLSFSPWS
jgi:hypothetical protein